MSTLIKKTLLACGLALAAGALCAAPAAEPKKPAAKARVKAKAPASASTAAAEPNEPEPDIKDTTTTEFNCELGNKVTTYHNLNDDSHIAIRWKNRLHRLLRVGTTTGAQRFENKLFGLIWIGIPAKGMLLDSKQNRQLANECKNAEQLNPSAIKALDNLVTVPVPGPAPKPAMQVALPAPAPLGTIDPPAPVIPRATAPVAEPVPAPVEPVPPAK